MKVAAGRRWCTCGGSYPRDRRWVLCRRPVRRRRETGTTFHLPLEFINQKVFFDFTANAFYAGTNDPIITYTAI